MIVPDTGSGYGGKHTGEAARRGGAAGQGRGQAGQAGLDPRGRVHLGLLPPRRADRDGRRRRQGRQAHGLGVPQLQLRRLGHRDALQGRRTRKVAFHATASPLRQGSYRALAATANHFARESLMDELAHAAGIDPLAFRLQNLEDPRLRAVLEDAAARFGWGKSKPATGHGFGLAGGTEKGGYVATCAEVAVDTATGAVKVVRAVTAFECGAIVNPDHLQEPGRRRGHPWAWAVRSSRRSGSRTARSSTPGSRATASPASATSPQIEVVLLDRKDLPSAGGGETPIVAIAPAIGNAIFDATGQRLRSMPLVPQGVVKS